MLKNVLVSKSFRPAGKTQEETQPFSLSKTTGGGRPSPPVPLNKLLSPWHPVWWGNENIKRVLPSVMLNTLFVCANFLQQICFSSRLDQPKIDLLDWANICSVARPEEVATVGDRYHLLLQHLRAKYPLELKSLRS